MKVADVMSRKVRTCTPEDDLGQAALEMWNGDCGILPVVRGGRVVGVVTDRDICMGVALSGHRPTERRVSEVMSKEIYSCVSDDDLGDALETMALRQVRRLPVIDGDQLVGILSMNDVVTRARRPGHPSGPEVLAALRAICAPHRETDRPTRPRSRRPSAA